MPSGGLGLPAARRLPGPPGDRLPAARRRGRAGRDHALAVRRCARADRPAADRDGAGAALLLVVAWQPDDRAATLARVAAGRYDAALRRLVRQLRSLPAAPILRPMPEPNTPWYAWSGEVSAGRVASATCSAWRHVWRVVRRTPGGQRIRLMWTPYARSVPDEAGNRIGSYFPGRTFVDAVGAVGYNFGQDRPARLDGSAGAVRGRVRRHRPAGAQAVLAGGDGVDRGRRLQGGLDRAAAGADRTRSRGCGACSGTTSGSRTATSGSRRRPRRRRPSRRTRPPPAAGSAAAGVGAGG